MKDDTIVVAASKEFVDALLASRQGLGSPLSVAASKEFVDALASFLKAHGFRKIRRHWFRDTREVRHVVTLQKSSWGGEIFYMDIGVQPLSESALPPMCASNCAIHGRWSGLFQEVADRDRLEKFLDFDANPDAPAIWRETMRTLEERVLPFFESLATRDDVRAYVRSNKFSQIPVSTPALGDLMSEDVSH